MLLKQMYILLKQEWEKDENIGAILIKGVGDKAFCAGGDVRGLS